MSGDGFMTQGLRYGYDRFVGAGGRNLTGQTKSPTADAIKSLSDGRAGIGELHGVAEAGLQGEGAPKLIREGVQVFQPIDPAVEGREARGKTVGFEAGDG